MLTRLKSDYDKKSRAFESWVRPHIDTLYKTAYRLTGQQAAAEDLVQDLLVKLYPKTDELLTIDQPSSWLKKSLYREFVDHYRKHQRRPQFDHDKSAILEGQPADTDGPEQHNEKAETSRYLETALATLDPASRQLVIMHLVEEYTLPECSELMEIPIETLKTRLRRAKARLKNSLGG